MGNDSLNYSNLKFLFSMFVFICNTRPHKLFSFYLYRVKIKIMMMMMIKSIMEMSTMVVHGVIMIHDMFLCYKYLKIFKIMYC